MDPILYRINQLEIEADALKANLRQAVNLIERLQTDLQIIDRDLDTDIQFLQARLQDGQATPPSVYI